MMPLQPTSYRLPDLHAFCPWKASFNPHYEDVSAEASPWALKYASPAVIPKNRLTFFEQKGSELLAAWAWPYAAREKLRTCCDFINITYVIDETCDCQSGEDAKATVATAMNAMADNAYDDGTALCDMVKDFKQRLFPCMGPISTRRFLEHMKAYVVAVGQEEELREHRAILDLAAYNNTRRGNSGTPFTFQLFGYVFGVDLPDEVYLHSAFVKMHFAAVDMVNWANDLYSYKVEVERGLDDNNVLTVLQNEMGISLQEASDYVGLHFKQLVDIFLSGKAHIPSFNQALDAAVSRYIEGMECWVIGNIEWSFQSQRYFGEERERVRNTLVVELNST